MSSFLFSGISKCPPVSRLQIRLPNISIHGRKFEFCAPIEPEVYLAPSEEEVWVCEWNGIVSTGDSAEEAGLSFCEDFAVFWDEIAEAPDDSLTKQAQATKHHMRNVVKSVR
jgi:hypothetical protein